MPHGTPSGKFALGPKDAAPIEDAGDAQKGNVLSMLAWFDGHNDLLLRLSRLDDGSGRLFLEGDGKGHLDLERCRQGGFAGGLFACFAPSPGPAADGPTPSDAAPAQVAQDDALRVTQEQVDRLRTLIDTADGALALCRTSAEIAAAMAAGQMACVLHVEGAEALGPDLVELDALEAAGLRSVGLVWSRSSAFGHGVPFRYFTTPDTGPGLTDAGQRLVRELETRRILIDVSHLNERGFWDVADLTERPFVATHANANALVPAARNLTDRQLDCLKERHGMVGLNLSVPDLRTDCRRDPETPLEDVVRMFDYLIERLGEDRVGLGSDFDGATIPRAIGDVAGLPALEAALRAHGYDDVLLKKLAHRNWLALLGRVWGG